MPEPTRSRRWRLAAAAAAVVLVLAVAVLVAVSRFEPQDLVALVSTKVKERTGRSLAIDGPVRYGLSWAPTVVAEGVRLQNADWGSRPDMLTARRIEVRVALAPLLFGEVELRGLLLVEPDLLLEVDRTGKKNWQLDTPAGASDDKGAPGGPAGVVFRQVQVRDGKIVYRDAGTPREIEATSVVLDVDRELTNTEIEGSATIGGVPVEVAATVPARGPGSANEAEANLKAPGIALHTQGKLDLQSDPVAADLAFSAEVSDWRAAGKLLGTELRARPPLKVKGALRRDAHALALEDLEGTIGKSVLTGHIRLLAAEGGQVLNARIDSPLIHLAELLGASTPKAHNDGRVFSAEPLALGALPALRAQVDARIARLALRDGKQIDDVQIGARLDGGRMTLEPALMHLDGKPLKMTVRADASSGKALKLDLAVDGKGIPLGSLGALLDITGTPEGSPTDLSIRLRTEGNSMRALMASANGDVRVVVGAGRVRNRVLDLGADVTEFLKVINPAYAADTYTELECAVIRLPIRQGVARVQNSIGLESAKVDIIGAGTIDFRHETLDLGFRAKAATGLGVGLGTLAQLGRLRGSFTNPKMEVDLGEAAETAAHVGLAAITGGISLIASGLLADRVPDRPCQVALTGSTPQQPTTTEKAPTVVDDVIESVKRLFR